MIAQEGLLQVVHERQRALLVAAIELYGDRPEDLLNALQELSARVAIAAGVEADKYAAGMKHHWDFLANAINNSTQ
jgi:hypothetical protein